MEDNTDFIDIFDSNQELNFNYDIEDTEEEDDNNDDSSQQDDAIDDDDDKSDQEGVDSDDDDNEGDDSDEESSPKFYSSIAEALHEKGLLPSFDPSTKIDTIDDFIGTFSKEIDIQSDLKVQQYLDNLDLEKVSISKKENLELDSLTEEYLRENLEVAKQIIYKDYLNQGLSDDRAKKLLKKTIDLGEDIVIEESLESIDSIKEYNKKIEVQEYQNAQIKLENIKKEQLENENLIKNFVFNSKEIVQGIPNTKVLQEKVYKSMLEPVAKNAETGEMMNKFMHDRSQNPIEFDIKMYYMYEMTNGFKDINNISKTTTSKAVKKLESTLRKTKFEDNGTPNFLQDPDSYSSGFGSELVF